MANAEIPVHAEQLPRQTQWQGVSVREDVLCSNAKGVAKDGIRKRQQKMIEKLAPALQQFLEPGEAVFYVTGSFLPFSQLQQFFLGWWAYAMMSTRLVFTNRRILMLLVTNTGTWKRRLSEMRWGDMQQAKASGWLGRGLAVAFKGGKKVSFRAISDVGKVNAIAAAILPASTTEGTGAQDLVSLCPECRAKLTPRVYQCPSCGLVFKNEKKLMLLGIFVPGGAYFYVGHPIFGAITALAEAFLWLEFLLCAVGALASVGKPDFSDLAGAAIYIFVILALETLLTLSHGRVLVRSYIPTQERKATVTVSSSSAAAGGFK